MMTFWIVCALLLITALAFVVWPLWFAKTQDNAVVRDAANLEIIRDQMSEMDADLANGLLTPELYEQGKHELQTRLLDEVKNPQTTTTADTSNPFKILNPIKNLTAVLAVLIPQTTATADTSNPFKILTAVLVVLIPLLSIGLYLKIGNTNAFLPQGGMAQGFGTVQSEAGLRALEEKVAASPNDPEALLILARSYAELERFPEAAKAFEHLTQMIPNEAGLWADYADVLAMVHGQKFEGGPTRLIEKALLLDPNHPKSLALAGSAAMERGDYRAAIDYWDNLLKQLPPGSEDAKMIEGGINQAHEFMAQTSGGKMQAAQAAGRPMPMQQDQSGASGGSERLTGTVTLSADLKGKAAPEDTLFVLARAAQGPKMPLAIMRKQVKDLPLSFALDDSMAMSPQMKLSSFPKVVVVARISKSGTAMPQSGDMQGVSAELSPGTKNIAVRIDQQIQ